MPKKLLLAGVLIALLFSTFLFPRLIGIKKFATGDEAAWLIFSHNYLHAISKGQFERTVYEYHPAVTTMWVITAGILSYFPDYIRIRHGYIEKFFKLDEIYAHAGKALSTVLYRSRMINVAIVSTTILIAFLLLKELAGMSTALVALLLVAFDPFFLGQSRILNHEGMASSLALVAILAMLIYLNQGNRIVYLLISAVASGLALLTKSPTILLIPLVGVMFLINLASEWRRSPEKRKAIWVRLRSYGVWLGTLALVYFALWPGMWVNPAKMLYEVYGNALSYAFQGQRLQMTKGLQPEHFSLDVSGIYEYISSLLFKTTPILWIGAVLAFFGLINRKSAPMERMEKQVSIYLLIIALVYILIFGVARGWNSPHYVMLSFVAFEVIAGIGYTWGVRWLGIRIPWLSGRAAQTTLLSAAVSLQMISALSQYPYYFTYTNPLIQALQPGAQDPAAGYGEGLDQAAAYLAQKPGAKHLIVTAHMGIGPFSYYFPGITHPMFYSGADYFSDLGAKWLRESDYIVTYDISQIPLNVPSKMLAALQGVPPEAIIYLNGIRYASIYKVSELPERVFASLLPPP